MELARPRKDATHDASVLVVDDHRAFAEALGLAVDLQPDMTFLGASATATDALHRLAATPADVVIVDIGLPEVDGIDILPEIRNICPDSRTLLITGSDDPEVLDRAGRAGADRLLRKVESLPKIIAAIRRSTATATTDPAPPGDPGASRLTERELEVLDLLSQGHSVTEIARRLDISVNTCRGYVRTILFKLDAHSQLAAVAHAARLGVLPVQRTDSP